MIYMQDDLFPLLQATSQPKEAARLYLVLSSHPEIAGAKLFNIPVWGSEFACVSFWRRHLTHAAELTGHFAAEEASFLWTPEWPLWSCTPMPSGASFRVCELQSHSYVGFSLSLEILNILWTRTPLPLPPHFHFALGSASYIASLTPFNYKIFPSTLSAWCQRGFTDWFNFS